MYPAIAKTLEQFYLLHILESFGSGNLRVKTIFNPSKKVYGPLVLEHKNKYIRNGILMEGSAADTLNPPPQFDGHDAEIVRTALEEIDDASKLTSTIPDGASLNQLTIISNEVDKEISRLVNVANSLHKQKVNADKLVQRIGSESRDSNENKSIKQRELKVAENWKNLIKDLQERAKTKIDMKTRTAKRLETLIRALGNESNDVSGKESREKESFEKEKLASKAKQAQTHGSYQVKDTTGVDLQPTMATVKVKIHYVGGPSEGTGSAGDHDYQEIAVGVKVIPVKVQNFSNIQDAILDDYFASKTAMLFKTIGRSVVRKSISWVEKTIKKISGQSVDLTQFIEDPVMRYILSSPQGFVDASSFKHNKNAPSFYNFSSASVVFLNDDMTHEAGENFFMNKQAMQRMFKAGWNTFIVLNNIEETAYFISSLDGGALHILPYSYIFNSLKMDKVYDSDDFKRRSRSFQTKSGGINTLASKLNRESNLYQSIKNVLQG